MTVPPTPDPARGVFTTLLVVDGAPVALDLHLARLGASVAALYGERLSADAAERAGSAARSLALGRLRVSYAPGDDVSTDAVAVAPEQVLPGWAAALDLRSVEIAGWDGSHKWADRRLLDALEASLLPAPAVASDTPISALLVTPGGEVLETTRSSIFAVVDGRLVTPPASAGILPGVVRAKVIELATADGIETVETRLTLAELAAASEAFATNSVRLLEPVRSLDGAPLPGPGPISERLTDRLRALFLSPAKPTVT